MSSTCTILLATIVIQQWDQGSSEKQENYIIWTKNNARIFIFLAFVTCKPTVQNSGQLLLFWSACPSLTTVDFKFRQLPLWNTELIWMNFITSAAYILLSSLRYSIFPPFFYFKQQERLYVILYKLPWWTLMSTMVFMLKRALRGRAVET